MCDSHSDLFCGCRYWSDFTGAFSSCRPRSIRQDHAYDQISSANYRRCRKSRRHSRHSINFSMDKVFVVRAATNLPDGVRRALRGLPGRRRRTRGRRRPWSQYAVVQRRPLYRVRLSLTSTEITRDEILLYLDGTGGIEAEQRVCANSYFSHQT